MKKIVIVNSSPRKNGNCDILCSEFGRGAVMNAGNEVVRFNLNDVNYDFYREDQAEDEFDNIANQMLGANVIVLATPVYFYSMSGQMKTLIDRMMPYFSRLTGKDFYFILTAPVNRKEMEPTAESLIGFTDSLNDCNVVHITYGSNVSQKGDIISTPAYKEVFEIASKIM
ncbi:MAG: NAD(P)H-dependent oxidoreductase [Erysipelotrichaceae bacterium]|nr:NAD(P)H-dependent oxidoreductase [Erysipelotrichaceae bacterium]